MYIRICRAGALNVEIEATRTHLFRFSSLILCILCPPRLNQLIMRQGLAYVKHFIIKQSISNFKSALNGQ